MLPFKVGILISDKEKIEQKMADILKKYSKKHEDKAVFKEKKKKI